MFKPLKADITMLFASEDVDKKRLFLLLSISFFFFYPVIYGGAYYADDVFRATVSSQGFIWQNLGRFFATDIAQLYSSNKNIIIDATPLTWILSIAIIGFSSHLVYLKFNREHQRFALPLSVVFIINPFLLENLLYRFDNLGMFLGMLFAVLAFTLNPRGAGLIIASFLLLVSLNFYQTFSNIFIALVAIELILMAHADTKLNTISKKLSGYIGVFFIANVAYFIELKIIGIPSRGATLPLELHSLELILQNYITAFEKFIYFWSYYGKFFYFIIPLAIISFVASRPRLKTCLAIVAGFILIFISTLGLMSLLASPPLTARTLHFFSPIMMLITLMLMIGNDKLKWMMVIPAIACFIFSYRVGNMQKIQSNFEKPIIYSLAEEMTSKDDIEKYYSIGEVPYSKYIKNIRENTPFNGFVKRGSWITVGAINEYAPRGLVAFEWSAQARKTREKFNDEKASMILSSDKGNFYKIYTKNNQGWIVWD